MNYFVDTNVPVGYTVIHDKWHESSKSFIEDNGDDLIFWSNFVKKEYDNKLDDILIRVHNFLIIASSILENNEKDFYSYAMFERFILQKTKFCELDDYKKQKILEHFWQKYDFIEGISSNVYSKFIKYLDDFKDLYIQRDLKLKEIMNLHDCGFNNYLKYYAYALRLYDGGVHPPDCQIIVDAHDCGLKHDKLIFVSNDEKMLEKVSMQDNSHLKIFEFRSCNS